MKGWSLYEYLVRSVRELFGSVSSSTVTSISKTAVSTGTVSIRYVQYDIMVIYGFFGRPRASDSDAITDVRRLACVLDKSEIENRHPIFHHRQYVYVQTVRTNVIIRKREQKNFSSEDKRQRKKGASLLTRLHKD
jgi:hypothetical protein